MKFSFALIIFTFLLFSAGINLLFAQTNPIGDQKAILEIKADSLYNQGVRNDKAGNYKQSLNDFKKALTFYKKIDNLEGIGDSYSYIAIMSTLIGKYPQAIESYKKGEEAYKKGENQRGLALVSHNLGKIYYLLGDYLKSLKYLKEALAIQRKVDNQYDTALIIQNIGIIYSDVKDYDRALKNYTKAKEIFERLKDSASLSTTITNIGLIQMEKGKFKQAHSSFEKALTIAKGQKDRHSKMEILYSLGKLFYAQSEYKNALSYYQLSLQIAEEMSNIYYQAMAQLAIGKIYNRKGQNQEAIGLCSIGLEKAKELNSNSLKKEAYTCLYKGYKAMGNNTQALAAYEKAAIFEDSLKIEETSQHLMNMQMQNKALADSLTFVKNKHTLQLKHQEEIQNRNTQRNLIIASLAIILIIAGGLWSRLRFVRKSGKALQKEKDRSENLLLNILPEEVANELKVHGKSEAQLHKEASVIFTDFVNFTQTSQKLGVKKLLTELNIYFTAFDEIMERHQIEKIKTIGDAYLAVCGLPAPNKNHALHTVEAAFEILEFIEKRKKESPYALDIRIGINSGPIIAGIIGVKKFAYDIWGDAVNTASRMEQNSEPGKINISESTYQLIKNEYHCTERGKIAAKGKGEINMYFINPMQTEQKGTNKEKMNYQALEKLMLDKLEKELPKHLTYHCVEHIIDVRDSAVAIAQQENIPSEEITLLKTAALFHDSGFIFGGGGHEEKSCEIAEQYLPDYGFNNAHIKQICGMIMATRLPQSPKTHLEEILADADLDYLGRDDFFTIGDGLYKEFLNSGVVNNEVEWDRLQVEFLEEHHYFTQTSIGKRKPKKMEHLQMLKSKLNQE